MSYGTAMEREAALLLENAELRTRLEELEEIQRAIYAGEVDALVSNDKVYTLEGAETPYRRLIETINEGAATLMENGTVLYANHFLAELLRTAVEGIIGSSLRRFVEQGDLPVFDALLAQAMQRSCKGELSLQRQDGQKVTVQVAFSILEAQGVRAVSVVATDLTERKQAEDKLKQAYGELEQRVMERTKELRQANAEQSTILNTAPVGVCLLKNRKVQWVNPAFDRILGYTEGKSIGLDTALFYASREEYERVGSAGYKQLSQGESYSTEVEMKRNDGSLLWVSVAGRFLDPQNQSEGSIWTLQDITERKRAENEALESQSKLKAALASMTDAVYICDAQGRFIDFNDAFATFHKFKNKGECAKHFEEYLDILDVFMPNGELAPLEQWPSHRALRGETVTNAEYVLRRKDTGESWVGSYSFAPICDKDGTIVGSVVTGRDITERKQLEAAQKKLEIQNRQLQKAESLGRMAGAIAHHFNNQLQAVMMGLQMAMINLPQNGMAVENLTDAMLSARKAAKVSSLMLTYLGQTTAKHEPLYLCEACQRQLFIIRADLPKDMVLETDFLTPGPVVNANANQIQQVLTNLVTNAWEALGDTRSAIRVDVKTVCAAEIPAEHRFPVNWQPQTAAYACLEVRDAGGGIAAVDMDKLFDPFFSSKFTGRGLGLPVVLGIVRAHSGCITVESQPGRGSVFRVFLPLSEEAVLQKPLAVTQAPRTAGHGTVLVVDDESIVRKSIELILKRSGFTVLTAVDGVDALELFRQHRDEIDCVLCDLTMPRMNGWETLTAMRKLSPGIPVILSSGYSEAQVMDGEHPELPQAFLSKPYQFETLIDAIARVMQQKTMA